MRQPSKSRSRDVWRYDWLPRRGVGARPGQHTKGTQGCLGLARALLQLAVRGTRAVLIHLKDLVPDKRDQDPRVLAFAGTADEDFGKRPAEALLVKCIQHGHNSMEQIRTFCGPKGAGRDWQRTHGITKFGQATIARVVATGVAAGRCAPGQIDLAPSVYPTYVYHSDMCRPPHTCPGTSDLSRTHGSTSTDLSRHE